jgi:hypothetical protein
MANIFHRTGMTRIPREHDIMTRIEFLQFNEAKVQGGGKPFTSSLNICVDI